MTTAIKQHVTVGPGGKIELHAPELREGQQAEVIVLAQAPSEPQHLTWREFAGSAKGLFKSAQEIDQYLRELRDEWEERPPLSDLDHTSTPTS